MHMSRTRRVEQQSTVCSQSSVPWRPALSLRAEWVHDEYVVSHGLRLAPASCAVDYLVLSFFAVNTCVRGLTELQTSYPRVHTQQAQGAAQIHLAV
jgi:hypothetical protein